ncbi:MAG: UDP-2,3-diacetamido-2,3-dideoxy-D-glucuronic acid 2-epimerase [Cytophagales bacterium]|jgi:UDP-GlcNAc3NAcA epimerase|nr:UDP-N-acetylglucosamine 2-epimerase (non-hydrolyzing) [Bacteroidota bacterium]MBS1981577.1 UDP-N-acetylglucosamine 2-epimerase (non-hydrolyzing) [Bacteroidota bacterium]WHZ08883.1 MAG: UDP-2,3-diacetamido-2,3-dideoxy-D-glucuronic acid 2-epimerase [Cytophagales bacterium]
MIVTIIGARPQFIKAAIVSKALSQQNIEEMIIHTGQHYDARMSDIFFNELGLKYTQNLNIGSGSHAAQTAEMMIKIEEILQQKLSETEAVLLYGDTNSTLAGAIVASKLGIKIIHVEAGLRSFNKNMPEEINRIMTDHVSDFLFCSSDHSVIQLKKEGIDKNVYEVGDVMYDAMLYFGSIANEMIPDSFLNTPFFLATIHRPQNIDNKEILGNILSAFAQSPVPLVWPLHPRAKKAITNFGLPIPENVTIREPFSYFEMLKALRLCDKVITDSGGLQKESYWMRKPCITLRNETEWVETLHHQWNVTVGTEINKIVEAMKIEVPQNSWTQLYGDGTSAKKIATIISEVTSKTW